MGLVEYTRPGPLPSSKWSTQNELNGIFFKVLCLIMMCLYIILYYRSSTYIYYIYIYAGLQLSALQLPVLWEYCHV